MFVIVHQFEMYTNVTDPKCWIYHIMYSDNWLQVSY